MNIPAVLKAQAERNASMHRSDGRAVPAELNNRLARHLQPD